MSTMSCSFAFMLWNLLFTFGMSTRYILTPKLTEINSLLDIHSVSERYNLEFLAKFEGDGENPLVFYTGKDTHVLQHISILSQIYDIEEDVEISLSGAEKKQFVLVKETDSVPWHLERVTKRKPTYENQYPYTQSGTCHNNSDVLINTYVVDTGIDIDHPQFESRAVWGANFADEEDTDCNNHGTHVAGLIGSRDYGVCKDANLYAVKVLDCRGSGSLSGVIRGIEWVFKKHTQTSRVSGKQVKSIINMSLGGGYSNALNRAVERCLMKNNDFYIVVAAGNENQDTCGVSPASAENVISVMASDERDNRAWFSNWGKCAVIYSPGVDVLSTIPGGDTARYSGTSMASPVVAGVLNHYLDMYPQHSQKQMKEIMQQLATKNVIRGKTTDTSNNLVYLSREL